MNFCFKLPGTQVIATDHETSKLNIRLLAINTPIIKDILNCLFPLKSTKKIVKSYIMLVCFLAFCIVYVVRRFKDLEIMFFYKISDSILLPWVGHISHVYCL